MLRKISIKEVRPSALLYVSAVIGFFAIVMLFSFHDDVTEVSFFGYSIGPILTDEFELSHWSATVMTPLGKIQRAYIALNYICTVV